MYLPGMTYGLGETPQYGSTAVYSAKLELPDDQPNTGSLTVVNILGPVTGDSGLVKYKRTQNDQFEPYLAESWTLSDDLKSWTFRLRPDVKWHDGTPLVAEDVKFYIDLAVSPPKGRRTLWSNQLPGLKEVQVLDIHTVRLEFEVSSPNLLEVFANTASTIALPRHLAQAELDKGNVTFGMSPLGWVGLGPFKLIEHVRGSSFRAGRFDQYWEKDAEGRALPYLDAVLFVPIPDKSVALSAFRAGRIDTTSRGAGANLDPEMVAIAKRTFGDKVWFMRHPYVNHGIQMNSLRPPFDDIRARQAVALYLNREDAAQKMYGGFAYTAGLVSPGSWWFSGAYANWPGFNPATKERDQAEAKRLLQEAGLAGTKVDITNRIDYLFIAEMTYEVLRGVGFEPRIQSMDVPSASEFTQSMRHQVSTGGAGVISGFPGGTLASWVSTSKTSGNVTNDTKIDEFAAVIATSLDPVVRRDALWAAERYIILEKAYNAPYYREEAVIAHRTYLKGVTVPGFASHNNTDRATDWIDKSMR